MGFAGRHLQKREESKGGSCYGNIYHLSLRAKKVPLKLTIVDKRMPDPVGRPDVHHPVQDILVVLQGKSRSITGNILEPTV